MSDHSFPAFHFHLISSDQQHHTQPLIPFHRRFPPLFLPFPGFVQSAQPKGSGHVEDGHDPDEQEGPAEEADLKIPIGDGLGGAGIVAQAEEGRGGGSGEEEHIGSSRTDS